MVAEKSSMASAASVLISFSTGAWGAITFQQWLAIFGAVATVISLAMNWYYNHKRLQAMQDKEQSNEA